ncbi:hypothetical protein GA0115240_15042 [Streptomyces sp. DvalAA-14]|uniref:hypothetical protein n=1 Tax=unclassified Streptomyces TaxID=2593676 RepID=UPI00081B9284|nr:MULTISPECIES: hypothetical protein [unclassified Streptomyces]MYS23255.1 hypothetical protein [Streptomyces sp. SID4948]SCE30260.1 hypothetical protein GA0115240_15042 [Streptomyces sp. DvalAA-14]
MTSPRPYVAAAAASVLAALYFVPSATASPVQAAPASAPAHSTTRPAGTTAIGTHPELGGLADTGAVNTKPYVIGGAAFLVAGAGLVLNAGRRSRSSAI